MRHSGWAFATAPGMSHEQGLRLGRRAGQKQRAPAWKVVAEGAFPDLQRAVSSVWAPGADGKRLNSAGVGVMVLDKVFFQVVSSAADGMCPAGLAGFEARALFG